MDFGTMTVKVTKGKYRSLEEFTVRLDWSDTPCCLTPSTAERFSACDDECQDVQSSRVDLLR